MSELASMAAFKTTNTNNITTIVSTSSTTTIQAQPNSPALSSTSSLVSPDSSATNPISSPDAQTPQNTPQTNSPLITGADNASESIITNDLVDGQEKNIKELTSPSTTPTNQNAPVNNTIATTTSSLDNNISIIETITATMSIISTTSVSETTKCDSPLIDTKSSGSVHEKASMFEKKLEEQQSQTLSTTTAGGQAGAHHPISLSSTLNLTPATVARLESIYGRKTEEIYNKTAGLLERVDTGQLLFLAFIVKKKSVRLYFYVLLLAFPSLYISMCVSLDNIASVRCCSTYCIILTIFSVLAFFV